MRDKMNRTLFLRDNRSGHHNTNVIGRHEILEVNSGIQYKENRYAYSSSGLLHKEIFVINIVNPLTTAVSLKIDITLVHKP